MITAMIPLLRAGAVGILLTVSGGTFAHEGHDHSDEKKTVAPATLTPRLEAGSGPFELVTLRGAGELLIYLDHFETNEPITGAQITVETPDGAKEASVKDGVYRLAAPWEQESLDLIFIVTEGSVTEVLSGTLKLSQAAPQNTSSNWRILSPAFAQGLKDRVGESGIWLLLLLAFVAGAVLTRLLSPQRKSALVVLITTLLAFVPHNSQAHEGERHEPPKMAAALTSDLSQRFADGNLFVPKPVQRILAIRTMVSKTSTHRRTIELPGRIIPDPNASGFVQASVSGRLSAPEGGFPRLGTVMKVGDVLAYVTPPFAAIDVSDMRQKQGELDQQIGIVEKRVARYEPLAKTGAVPKVTLDEAILELKGLRDRRAALDKVRAEPEKLIAPVSGVIASANAVAGQIAETNAIVFQIINPSRLWVEALTFALGLPRLAIPRLTLESGRSWPAFGLAGAQRRTGQTLAASSSRAPVDDSRARNAV
jgi:hypothetical protein